MLNFTEFLVLLAQIFSLCCKVYLLGNLGYRISSLDMRKPTILLGILLVGAIMRDASYIGISMVQIFCINDSYCLDVLTFVCRLGWFTFLTQHQALAFLLEYIIEKRIRFKIRDMISYIVNIGISLCFLYLALFKFNIPSDSSETLGFESKLVKIAYLYLFPLLCPAFFKVYRYIKAHALPKILTHQLRTFIGFLIIPHLFLEVITNQHSVLYPIAVFIPLSRYTLLGISTILCNYALYYCCKRMMGLRFLNMSNQVESRNKFNFINDFKDILEQLSYLTSMKEVAHLTQVFFKEAFSIPVGRTRLYMRKTTHEQDDNAPYHDIIIMSTKVENFIMQHDGPLSPIFTLLYQSKIFIKDEIEFTHFYNEQVHNKEILSFLDTINADIFLPIYERQMISAYIIVERNACPDRLFNSTERDEMLVFTSYLSNIINILKHSNLEVLLKHKKDLEEELYNKHQEINQYKESIRSFLRAKKERNIGILFYKGRRFMLANQAAQELIGFDVNLNQGHQLAQSLKQIARKVQEYKASQTVFARDAHGNRLILAGIPSLDVGSVIIMIYYPEISDIIKSQFEMLKDPSSWDYILYLETTKSGQLINQLIPGNGEILLNFKISLLATALSKKATLLQIAEDDLTSMVELLHHISLRQTLHVLKLSTPEKNDEVAIKLFGINPLLSHDTMPESLFQKLDDVGTLFIENVHLLSLETQQYLAEFITYGFYYRFKSDYKMFSNVRIICSTPKNLQHLVTEGLFSKALFNELNKTVLSMPALMTLPETEISQLAYGFTEQAIKTQTYKNLLELSDRDKNKLLDQRPISLQELKAKVHQILVQKTNKHHIYDQTEFDPAYHVSDPELAQAVRLGKKALKDPQIMTMLWDKFKNQNKIATLLGVNRSSVNRRCQEYKLYEK